MNKIERLLKAMRDSSDTIYSVYTEGSCYQLYKVLKTLYPKAKPYWSDKHNHAITKIKGEFYDIGGKLEKTMIPELGYYKIPKKHRHGFDLLKSVNGEPRGVDVDKYYKK